MESGGSSSIVINEGGRTTTTTTANNSADADPQQSFKRAADQYMPIAHVVRIMRHVLPPHAKIADDAKETIQECVSEFINFVTTQANERCHGEYRKTISPYDVLSAMGSLGFDNYVEPLTVFLDKHRAQDPERRATHLRYAPYARHGVHGPVAQMGRPQAPVPPPGLTTAGTMDQHGSYVELPPQIDGYFMGGQDGGEGFSGRADLDPFEELFK